MKTGQYFRVYCGLGIPWSSPLGSRGTGRYTAPSTALVKNNELNVQEGKLLIPFYYKQAIALLDLYFEGMRKTEVNLQVGNLLWFVDVTNSDST